jgi:hypothetical protein
MKMIKCSFTILRNEDHLAIENGPEVFKIQFVSLKQENHFKARQTSIASFSC